MSRNLVDLWIYATGTDYKAAITEIVHWLGLPENELPKSASVRSVTPPQERKLFFPLLERPTNDEVKALSISRSLPVEALLVAVERQFLWIYTDRVERVRAWLITDSARRCAISRRMDGRPWASIGGKKSKTLFGSWAHWPIGLPEAGSCPAIGLVEGSPDFLSLIAHAQLLGLQDKVAPVCMAGAQMTIPQSVLPLFGDKKVQIFVHNDEAGICGARRWYHQLYDVAATLDAYSFYGLIQTDGSPVEDLNDLCRLAPDSGAAHSYQLAQLLEFAA
jgi:hypothetical protein